MVDRNMVTRVWRGLLMLLLLAAVIAFQNCAESIEKATLSNALIDDQPGDADEKQDEVLPEPEPSEKVDLSGYADLLALIAVAEMDIPKMSDEQILQLIRSRIFEALGLFAADASLADLVTRLQEFLLRFDKVAFGDAVLLALKQSSITQYARVKAPTDAIVDIGFFPTQNTCPTSDIPITVPGGGISCAKPYDGSLYGKVLTGLLPYVPANGCAAGYVREVLSTQGSVCAKYTLPVFSTGFITHIEVKNPGCQFWQKEVAIPETPTSRVCYSSYDKNGRPEYAIGSLYVSTSSAGCLAGEKKGMDLRAGILAVGSSVTCSVMTKIIDGNTMVLSETVTMAHNAACPAGLNKIGDLLNTHDVSTSVPLCAKYAPVGTNTKLMTYVYRGGFQFVTFNSGVKRPCGHGDKPFGDVPIYNAGSGSDIFAGYANLCVDY